MARRENGRGGGPHAVTTLILSSRPRATLVPREGTTLTKNGRETKAIALEKDRARAGGRRRNEESIPVRKKRGKRSSWGGCELA